MLQFHLRSAQSRHRAHEEYSPGEASLGILTSIYVTAYEAIPYSKCKDKSGPVPLTYIKENIHNGVIGIKY